MAIELNEQEIEEIIRGEEDLEESDRELLILIAAILSYDITVFASRITGTVDILRRTGTSNAGIAELLRRDLDSTGRIFGELRNSIKRGIVSGILQFSRVGGIELYGDGVELYRWVVISGVENCSDCLGREGQVDTLEGWEDRGLPGAGWSKCRGNCYCQLVPDTVDSDFALKIP